MADPDDIDPGPGDDATAGVLRQGRGLYLLVLCFLGAALFIALIGWIALAMNDKQVPEAMPILCAVIVGGFVGLVSSERSSAR
jgi:fucose permease